MPFEIKQQTVEPGDIAIFDFDNDVKQFTVGFSEFSLTYGSNDHHIRRISVDMKSNLNGNRQLVVDTSAVISDDSGHILDKSDSSIKVVALAWTSPDATSLVMTNREGIANNGTSTPISLPDSNPNIFQSNLSGFYLEYSADHHLRNINCAVGVEPAGNEGYITGRASMSDDSGSYATTTTVDGGMVASSDSSPGFEVRSTTTLQNSSETLNFSSGLNTFAALIVSFKGEYSGDHHVKTIGPSVQITNDGSGSGSVTVTGEMTLKDDSGHGADGNSYITAVVYGYKD